MTECNIIRYEQIIEHTCTSTSWFVKYLGIIPKDFLNRRIVEPGVSGSRSRSLQQTRHQWRLNDLLGRRWHIYFASNSVFVLAIFDCFAPFAQHANAHVEPALNQQTSSAIGISHTSDMHALWSAWLHSNMYIAKRCNESFTWKKSLLNAIRLMPLQSANRLIKTLWRLNNWVDRCNWLCPLA